MGLSEYTNYGYEDDGDDDMPFTAELQRVAVAMEKEAMVRRREDRRLDKIANPEKYAKWAEKDRLVAQRREERKREENREYSDVEKPLKFVEAIENQEWIINKVKGNRIFKSIPESKKLNMDYTSYVSHLWEVLDKEVKAGRGFDSGYFQRKNPKAKRVELKDYIARHIGYIACSIHIHQDGVYYGTRMGKGYSTLNRYVRELERYVFDVERDFEEVSQVERELLSIEVLNEPKEPNTCKYFIGTNKHKIGKIGFSGLNFQSSCDDIYGGAKHYKVYIVLDYEKCKRLKVGMPIHIVYNFEDRLRAEKLERFKELKGLQERYNELKREYIGLEGELSKRNKAKVGVKKDDREERERFVEWSKGLKYDTDADGLPEALGMSAWCKAGQDPSVHLFYCLTLASVKSGVWGSGDAKDYKVLTERYNKYVKAIEALRRIKEDELSQVGIKDMKVPVVKEWYEGAITKGDSLWKDREVIPVYEGGGGIELTDDQIIAEIGFLEYEMDTVGFYMDSSELDRLDVWSKEEGKGIVSNSSIGLGVVSEEESKLCKQMGINIQGLSLGVLKRERASMQYEDSSRSLDKVRGDVQSTKSLKDIIPDEEYSVDDWGLEKDFSNLMANIIIKTKRAGREAHQGLLQLLVGSKYYKYDHFYGNDYPEESMQGKTLRGTRQHYTRTFKSEGGQARLGEQARQALLKAFKSDERLDYILSEVAYYIGELGYKRASEIIQGLDFKVLDSPRHSKFRKVLGGEISGRVAIAGIDFNPEDVKIGELGRLGAVLVEDSDDDILSDVEFKALMDKISKSARAIVEGVTSKIELESKVGDVEDLLEGLDEVDLLDEIDLLAGLDEIDLPELVEVGLHAQVAQKVIERDKDYNIWVYYRNRDSKGWITGRGAVLNAMPVGSIKAGGIEKVRCKDGPYAYFRRDGTGGGVRKKSRQYKTRKVRAPTGNKIGMGR
jgi:hypothetical protein